MNGGPVDQSVFKVKEITSHKHSFLRKTLQINASVLRSPQFNPLSDVNSNICIVRKSFKYIIHILKNMYKVKPCFLRDLRSLNVGESADTETATPPSRRVHSSIYYHFGEVARCLERLSHLGIQFIV